MNEEARESKHIKMKPSTALEAHLKAKEQGKTLGRWIEEAIEEKIEREERVKANIEKTCGYRSFIVMRTGSA